MISRRAPLGLSLGWRALVLVGVAVIASVPSEARACGACVCYAEEQDPWVLPSFSRAAPLNLRMFVWLEGKDESTLRLATSEGAEVPFQLTPAGRADAYWLEPTELLMPSTDYELSVERLPTDGELVGPFELGFTTAESEDFTPPAVGEVFFSDGGRADMCAASIGSDLRIASVVDDGVNGGMLVVQLDLDTASGADRVFLPFNTFTTAQSAAFGSSLDDAEECFGYRGLLLREEGTIYAATATVWDWSGNATVVSDLSVVTTRDDPAGCPSPSGHGGCAATGQRSTAGFILPIVAGVMLHAARRRRRSR